MINTATAGNKVATNKKDYWSNPDVLKAHAEKRRKKYKSNPEYRRAELQRQREVYEAKKGGKGVNKAREALTRLDPTEDYTAAELSIMLGRQATYLNRLILKSLWPKPSTHSPYVFTGSVAIRLFRVFAEHLDTVTTYRGDHTDTTAALFAAFTKGD